MQVDLVSISKIVRWYEQLNKTLKEPGLSSTGIYLDETKFLYEGAI